MTDILDYCKTDAERRIYAAWLEEGSKGAAARELGLDRRHVARTIERVNARAARNGFAPAQGLDHKLPPGMKLKRWSKYHKDTTEWVIAVPDKDQREEYLHALVAGFAADLPRAEPVPMLRRQLAEDLLDVYILTDFHLGMYAWAPETGADWDAKIAEDLLVRWFQCAIRRAPDSQTAVLAQLGDFLHWDGFDSVTPAHRHLLDADTRFPHLTEIAVRVTRRAIGLLLEKYGRVVVLMAEGNHDPASSVWMRTWLAAHYEDEPRVVVDTSPSPYYAVEHGETAVFFHHGHKRTVRDIDRVLVSKFRELYGRTRHHECHIGHLHHDRVHESALMRVCQHRTLAAPDAYAARGGWESERDSKVITYHKRYGRVSEVVVSPDMALAA